MAFGRVDDTKWKAEALRKEFDQQLMKAADRNCPKCARDKLVDPSQ
jgi:hypothetical protein